MKEFKENIYTYNTTSSDLVIELNPIRKNKKTVKEIVENFLIINLTHSCLETTF